MLTRVSQDSYDFHICLQWWGSSEAPAWEVKSWRQSGSARCVARQSMPAVQLKQGPRLRLEWNMELKTEGEITGKVSHSSFSWASCLPCSLACVCITSAKPLVWEKRLQSLAVSFRPGPWHQGENEPNESLLVCLYEPSLRDYDAFPALLFVCLVGWLVVFCFVFFFGGVLNYTQMLWLLW